MVIYFLFDLLKFIDYWMLILPFKIVVCTFVLFFSNNLSWDQLYTNKYAEHTKP